MKVNLSLFQCDYIYLCKEHNLTGTKLGCGEGGCGACTVMISHVADTCISTSINKKSRVVHHRAVNACLAPLYSVEGMHVVTVEGIGDSTEKLHPIQQRLADTHGQQCGFCTPGFVMSMYSLLRNKAARNEIKITEEEIDEALSGNLCRCTGYRPILEAFREFAKTDDAAYHYSEYKSSEYDGMQHHEEKTAEELCSSDGSGSNGEIESSTGNVTSEWRNGNGENGSSNSSGNSTFSTKICPSSGLPCECGHTNGANGTHDLKNGEKDTKKNKEIIFPSFLKRRTSSAPMEIACDADNCQSWYRPSTLSELLKLRLIKPDARLVVGATETTIESRMRGMPKGGFISATHVSELNEATLHANFIRLGGSITLTRLQSILWQVVDNVKRPKCQARVCKAILRQLRWFAGVQIRNVASIAGNICTASPISDLNPLWIAAGSTITVASARRGYRNIEASKFFVGYRKTAMESDEVLVCIDLPLTTELEFVREFKQSHRREDDIAIVNAGMRVKLEKMDEGDYVCVEAILCFGGVGATPIRAQNAESFLMGKKWGSAEILLSTIDCISKDIILNEMSPGGMAQFRRSLTASFFFKFYAGVCNDLLLSVTDFNCSLPQLDREAGTLDDGHVDPVRGVQVYDPAEEQVAAMMSSGAPIKHRAGDQQVTGEAQYGDDIELPPSALHGALVLSTKAHARILSIDATNAYAYPGVVAFFSSVDLPSYRNKIGPVVKDEEVFVSEEVTCVGQTIGLIVADSHLKAKEAAKLVKISYEELPSIMSIREAIESQSFYSDFKELECGNVGDAFDCTESKLNVVVGEIVLGGQEHFYLEPNNVTVYTGENSEVLCISSTQALHKHQVAISSVLGIPMHKVVCRTKRIGGGFGGKETRAIGINAAAAVAAFNLKRPVRICLDRDEDMATTGHRHPFLGQYRAACSSDGKIVAAEITMYSNGGNSLDLSEAVMERAVFHADNCYDIANIRIRGRVCKTNTTSNTAFRGFGGPQGMMIVEAMIDDVARNIDMEPEILRRNHLYKENDITPFGMRLSSFKVPECWAFLEDSLADRRMKVKLFNSQHKWKKRGLAAIPTKFGISFTATVFNQAGALIHIYTDGTVLVTHGGVEMGQGLHTKIAQIVATELNISVSEIYIAETSTDKVPNASPSAASASTDLYGAAAQDACRQLYGRLEPYLERHCGDFRKAVSTAYVERVDLSAHGFYKTPDIYWDWRTKSGRPFHYFTFGAAMSEVEIDVLSGDTRLLSSDIIMDVGLPVNPAIDVGQIEGGFVQGLGWCLLEELKWGDCVHPWARSGHLITRGPGAYKIPTADDIPRKFNVTLLRNSPNPRAIHSSKAIGEPPFFLAASAFFATKDAIYAAREDSGHKNVIPLDLPATPERVRLSCGDNVLLRTNGEEFSRAALSA